ncbi:hypothetical protein [Pedobacter sp. CG_S7]|uniref:hypothetical protein n=1 Tax=Pedobacter sp. CG_S7 TaxID=3143930 RepID=UPI00339262B4
MLCVLVLLFSVTSTFAQTWGEFFNQKKTQKKYLLEQLVALKIYAGYLKKGYDIASSGIATVKDLKNGEFSLHNAFVSSLKSVSPAIRNSAKVAEIISCQLAISRAFNGIGNGHPLTLSNQLYILDVRDNVMEECLNDLEELLLVITSRKVEMTDDERIKRLDKVYSAMKEKSAFVQSFTTDVSLLIRQRENEQKSIDHLKELYGNE